MINLEESDGEFRVIFWLQVTENQLELTLGGKEDYVVLLDYMQ